MNFNRLPVVAIVGRPNVGKSMLFNRLLGKKVAITHETSGVTRDRLYRPVEWAGRHFLLADTGGVAMGKGHLYGSEILAQVETAIAEAACVVFLADAGDGVLDDDRTVLQRLRKFRKKMMLVVNKCDLPGSEEKTGDFYSLGLGEPRWVSALHGIGIGDLLDAMLKALPEKGEEPALGPSLRLAVLGRPNVGKSTFVNAILGEKRMIADMRPGTTRDAVDTYFDFQGQEICLIDTAGLRKKARVKDPLEYYSGLRARGTLERCDVALILLDAGEGPEQQDLRIFQEALDAGKGVVVGINKWDLLPKDSETFDAAVKAMIRQHPKMNHVPVLSISAKSGLRCAKAVELALSIHESLGTQFPQEELDRFLEETVAHSHPPADGGRPVIFKGIEQVSVRPLVFRIPCTRPLGVLPSYVRYLENQMYERFESLIGCPVRLRFVKTRSPAKVAAE